MPFPGGCLTLLASAKPPSQLISEGDSCLLGALVSVSQVGRGRTVPCCQPLTGEVPPPRVLAAEDGAPGVREDAAAAV